MYAERIKLKAHNYPSLRSGDSDPVTAEDKHGSRAMKEATRFTSDPHRQVGVGVIHNRMDLKFVYLRHTQAFNGSIHCYWVSTLLLLFQELFLTCFTTRQGSDYKPREKTTAYEHNVFAFSFGDVLNVQAQLTKAKQCVLFCSGHNGMLRHMKQSAAGRVVFSHKYLNWLKPVT